MVAAEDEMIVDGVERFSGGIGKKVTAERVGRIGRSDSFEEVGSNSMGRGYEIVELMERRMGMKGRDSSRVWGGGRVMIISTREGIGCYVGFPRSIVDLKIELLKKFRPANLARGKMRLG